MVQYKFAAGVSVVLLAGTIVCAQEAGAPASLPPIVIPVAPQPPAPQPPAPASSRAVPAGPSLPVAPQSSPGLDSRTVYRPAVTHLPAHLRPRFRHAPSLWDRRKPSKIFLFHDTQARQVGDLLTILISESTDVDNSESRALEKESDDRGLLDVTTSTSGDLGASAANLKGEGQSTSKRGFDGSAKFSSARQFTDSVAVTVLEVLPNGNLRIGGQRRIQVAGDQRILCVTGVVRPIDVRADNSIASRSVASLKVSYDGNGVESRFTNQGWLSRISNRIWPF
ncbi:MAG: flagellar basal body L-ring protein FlgH [Planctomycetaceae bacterium]